MSTELKRYNVEHRYSDAAVFNGVVYVAGQVPETTLDAGIAEQTAEVLAIIDRVLAANGSDKTRILMCQIFLKDITEIGEMNRAVSYTHLTLPTNTVTCRSRWSPYH